VQFAIGYCVPHDLKRPGMLKGSDLLFHAHRAIASSATSLCLLGLFAGVNGLVGAPTSNEPCPETG
jgi:hypothetical protein